MDFLQINARPLTAEQNTNFAAIKQWGPKFEVMAIYHQRVAQNDFVLLLLFKDYQTIYWCWSGGDVLDIEKVIYSEIFIFVNNFHNLFFQCQNNPSVLIDCNRPIDTAPDETDLWPIILVVVGLIVFIMVCIAVIVYLLRRQSI